MDTEEVKPKTKKKSKIKRTKKKKEPELTQVESLRLELGGVRQLLAKEKVRTATLMMNNSLLEKKTVLLEKEILGLKHQDAIRVANEAVTKELRGYQKDLAKVKSRLGIEGAFGWDPETLKVVTET